MERLSQSSECFWHFSQTPPMAFVRAFAFWPHDELVDINIGRLLDGECDGTCNSIGVDCGIIVDKHIESYAAVGD